MISGNCLKFCNGDISKIENYLEAITDRQTTLVCHHRLEIQGQFRNSAALLKKLGLYYDRPASELIFMPHDQHSSIHHKGKNMSAETRAKLSAAGKGRTVWNGKHHSVESRQKMSLAHKGKQLSEEHKRHLSEALKGHVVSKSTRQKISQSKINKE